MIDAKFGCNSVTEIQETQLGESNKIDQLINIDIIQQVHVSLVHAVNHALGKAHMGFCQSLRRFPNVGLTDNSLSRPFKADVCICRH